MKPSTQLAHALADIATSSSTIESKANAILGIIRGTTISNDKTFSAAVREAYKVNGWNVAAGRPAPGVRLDPVPVTVKQYVSRVRAAFRAKLPVRTFKTFHELRKALKIHAAKRAPQASNDPVFEGIRLTAPADELNGAPFHDLAALYSKLGKQKQGALVDAISRLVKQYQPIAHLALVKRAA